MWLFDADGYMAGQVACLVDEPGIEPHVKLMDKSERTDGTLSRSHFVYNPERDLYEFPGGKELRKYRRAFLPQSRRIVASGVPSKAEKAILSSASSCVRRWLGKIPSDGAQSP